ncbi:HlyU family transcriptional regulator [Tropicibacter oceani]|uniref:HlyU family transcriptional regulator n=1 Tax=Tropicibacter oceani TaxID=3058420 RepID=A0ABY8QH22_9RHOB|nr:HlyU family transcriptional regulator [Tropicibacter oceani]WGW03834.1 HlyU family transcriptional regulator [Tropicibacter oceani]
MSWLSRIFKTGGQSPSALVVEEYEGFRITPQPMPVDGQFRISALIEKDVAGDTKSHHLIRADLLRDLSEAQSASINKAKQLIDQQGLRLFD